jgi:tetratricopeptide (TPR) repeat protein
MGIAYIYWRPLSWRNAFMIVVAMHALYNGTLYVLMVADQVHKEIVIAGLKKSIVLYPDTSTYYYLSLGLAYRDVGRLEEGESALRQALASNNKENKWEVWYDLSFVLYDEKRFNEALDDAQRALLIAPADKQSDIKSQIGFLAPKANGTSD